MNRLLLVGTAILLLSSSVAWAQETTGQVEDGFKLGKFHVSAGLLATELFFIQALAEELAVSEITDENLAQGLITEEDVDNAAHLLAYTIWRVQFAIEPLLDSGLEEDALSHPALEPLAADTRALLLDVQAATFAFMEGTDFEALTLYVEAIADGEYSDQLMALSERAAELAGVEE